MDIHSGCGQHDTVGRPESKRREKQIHFELPLLAPTDTGLGGSGDYFCDNISARLGH